MKKILKWVGIVLGSLTGLLALALLALSMIGGARLNKTHDIQADAITIPTDEVALKRGEFLANAICTSCHGADLSGKDMIEEPGLATVYATNITGLGGTHSDADLVRAIRHGVDKNGRQLVVMPAEVFINFSAEDLGAIIAYLKTVPRVGDDVPEPQFSFPGRIMLAAGVIGDIFPAEYIDHNKPFPEMPPIGANPEYGAYLGSFCKSCHGEDLSGGQPADPASPPGSNLAVVKAWSQDEFIQTMRTGVIPYGRQLDPEFMPWDVFGKFSDHELSGLWMYLQSLPPQETTTGQAD